MSGTGDVASRKSQEGKSPEVQVKSEIKEFFPLQSQEEKVLAEKTKVPEVREEARTKEDVPQKIQVKGKRKNNTKRNKIKVVRRKKSKKNESGMKKKAKKNNKATNKNLIKVINDKKEVDSDFTSKPQEVENIMNDTQELNLKLVEEVVKNHGGNDALGLVLKPVEEIAERNPKNDNPGSAPKPVEETAGKNIRRDNPELPSKRSLASTYFVLLILASLILFLLAGYIYPATEEDIAKNKIFWVVNDGEFDRGLFTQFYSSLIFTACVFVLGFYVNSTFIRFSLGGWTTFSIGIYMMFLFGLGKIGELTYNHQLFSAFKNLILPFALIILAHASYRILKELKGGVKNAS
ncbi:Uncharacterised protein [uncultured archaeon]|nr:Uncharacterised protein [uncultured archaeon]